MSEIIKCQDCEKDATMFEGDNTGYCYEHTIDHAQEEFEREQEEKETGITQLEIIQRAMEKNIPLKQAKEELLKEAKKKNGC